MQKQPVCIVLIGAQGSGKSVLVERFENEGFLSFQMSSLLVGRADADKEFAQKYKIFGEINNGSLIDDEGVFEVFERAMETVPVGANIILDGCIRTPTQASFVIQHLFVEHCLIFIHIDCSIETSLRRISGRIKETESLNLLVREDDKSTDAIKARLDKFKKNLPGILRMINHFGYQVFRIDGEMDKDSVFEQALFHV